MSKKKTETPMYAEAVKIIKAMGGEAQRINSGEGMMHGRYFRGAKKGTPDVLSCIPLARVVLNLDQSRYFPKLDKKFAESLDFGLFVGVECKLPGKPLSDVQKDYRKVLANAGGVYITCHDTSFLQRRIEHACYLYAKRIADGIGKDRS